MRTLTRISATRIAATRIAAVGVVVAVTVGLSACSGSESPSAGTVSAPAAPTVVPAPTSTVPPVSDGVTTVADVFGPACAQLPRGDAPGSPTAMSAQPVATAVAANPLLTTLAAAVGVVPGLADTLDAQKGVTVLAPADTAFDALRRQLGEPAYAALMADPNKVGALLQSHVAGARFDAASLVTAGTVTELAGGTVRIGGTPQAPTVTDGKGDTATVLCGDLPTTNATVFVVDKVLVPAS